MDAAIKFLTLFLGLVAGPQEVHVQAAEDVMAVELRLDGRAVARREEPPWRFEIDFGSRLLPRELTAVAFGPDGGEIGSTTQQLNRPRAPVEARILLERDAEGQPVTARLSWQGRESRYPLATRVLLDGAELVVVDPESIPLPATDPRELHLLQAEMSFAGNITAKAQVRFGGVYGEEVDTRLTALPVVVERRLPRGTETGEWFERNGAPLKIAAIEKGPAEVLIVRGEGVAQALESLPGVSQGLGTTAVSSATGRISLNQADVGATASLEERLRRLMTLEGESRLRLVLPVAKRVRHPYLEMKLFATSPAITNEQGGLYWALMQRIHLPGTEDEQRLADAVAIAGLRAAAEDRRRTVILTLAAEAEDASRFDPETVRSYLERMGVPFSLWLVGTGLAVDSAWGAPVAIEGLQDLRRAVRDLEKSLDRQRIVWLEGAHPTDQIGIRPNAPFRALGAAPGR